MNFLWSFGFIIILFGSVFRYNLVIFSGLIFSGIVLLIFNQEMVDGLLNTNKSFNPRATRYFSMFSGLALIVLGIYGLLGGQFVGR